MSAWVYVVAAAAVLFVLWAAVVRGWWRSVRYSWRRAAHVLAADEAEARGQDFYGSMSLAEELGYRAGMDYAHGGPRPDPGVIASLAQAPDWREQTAADLAPEALNDQPDPYLDALTEQYGSEYVPDEYEEVYMAEHHPTALLTVGPPPEGGPWHPPPGVMGQVVTITDSGPGGLSSLTPGPDPAWLDGQLAVLYAWVRDQHATALA